MSRTYHRPLVQFGAGRTSLCCDLGGGPGWFSHVEVMSRGALPKVVPARDLDAGARATLTAPRGAAIPGAGRRAIMGILNVTPDSFSDGGRYLDPEVAVAAARDMVAAGADVVDIGGESTRPGAAPVVVREEIARTAPVISALRDAGVTVPISIDTRKAQVAEAALEAGATLVNDVSGFTFDPDLAPLCAARGVPVCVMHAQGDPQTMQNNPVYDDVLLDVFDFLAERIGYLESLGVPRARIIADPGIGFGKTMAHNLALLQRISLFHDLGVAILLGASRKGFIGKIGNAPQADDRAPGSVAVALAAMAQGVQIVRVHDVAETRQALALWEAVEAGGAEHG